MSRIAGLPKAAVDAAARRAEEKGMGGWWVFGLDNASLMPFLQFDGNRELRTKLLNGYLNRGNNDNANDNKAIVIELVNLSNRKAKIMGYDNYAQYVLEDRMAKTPEAVYALLDQLWTPALNSARKELADMEPIARGRGCERCSYRRWTGDIDFEKAKTQKFNFSEDELSLISSSRMSAGASSMWRTALRYNIHSSEQRASSDPEAQAFLCKDADGTTLGEYSWICLPVPVLREAEHGVQDIVSSVTRTGRESSHSVDCGQFYPWSWRHTRASQPR